VTYLKLTLNIDETQFEALEALLSSSGALSVTLEDAGDEPILEPGVAETPLWQKLKLSALFPANVNQKKLRHKLEIHLAPDTFATLCLKPIKDEVWELKWLEHFTPINFGNTLWVGTQQHQPEHDYQALIYLEPGLAFGTGTHPSTYLCLEWLATHAVRDKIVIDYGCGSGILAIAAMRLGAKKLLCVDNDPQALLATQNNAEQNQVELTTFLPEALPEIKVDILLANILANPLINLAPTFMHLLKPQGELVLAGILQEQIDRVQQAYAKQISWQEVKMKDGWACLSGHKI
jgi:ribosomal protein L11 methyltransferase